MIQPLAAAAIREHAEAEYPREACGLLIVVKGKQRYVPCRNIAATPIENFILHPEDLANAEDVGEVVGVVHSHPDMPATMSQADLVVCEQGELPWYIVSVGRNGCEGEICRYTPTGYAAPLIGRQFSHGVLDCYTLVRDYYAENLGIKLLDFERRDNWWHNGEDLYMRQFADAGFVVVNDGLQLHDGIIMQVRSPVANHAGVYIGDGQMIHHMYGRLSTRDVYNGYFQEVTRAVVRHKDMLK